jgi:hypothetical protein
MPEIFGVGMVHVCNISGGATMPPKRDAAANARIGVDRVLVLRAPPPSAGSSAGSPDRARPRARRWACPMIARIAASAFSSRSVSSDIISPVSACAWAAAREAT